MESIITALFGVSNALLLPIVIALFGSLAWVLLSLGGLMREARARRDQSAKLARVLPWFGQATHSDRPGVRNALIASGTGGFIGRFARLWKQTTSLLAPLPLLGQVEVDIARSLARHALHARLGPMLGLMGTLIPLGPALLGLSDGQLDRLAQNLVVAFSTTVIGLLAGGLWHFVWHVRRHWYARDLAHLEALCDWWQGQA